MIVNLKTADSFVPPNFKTWQSHHSVSLYYVTSPEAGGWNSSVAWVPQPWWVLRMRQAFIKDSQFHKPFFLLLRSVLSPNVLLIGGHLTCLQDTKSLKVISAQEIYMWNRTAAMNHVIETRKRCFRGDQTFRVWNGRDCRGNKVPPTFWYRSPVIFRDGKQLPLLPSYHSIHHVLRDLPRQQHSH